MFLWNTASTISHKPGFIWAAHFKTLYQDKSALVNSHILLQMLKSVVYNYLDIYKCTYVLQKYSTLLYKANLIAYITYTYSKWCQIMSLTLYQHEESYA